MSGKKSRNKGHRLERLWVKKLKAIGFKNACTSRNESKRLDDKLVDIAFAYPFNFQCKATERIGSLHKILAAMPNDNNYNAVVHKRNHQGTTVTLEATDFLELVYMLKSNNIL